MQLPCLEQTIAGSCSRCMHLCQSFAGKNQDIELTTDNDEAEEPPNTIDGRVNRHCIRSIR